MKGFVVVEGKGELDAAQNLLTRLKDDLGLAMHWAPPRRFTNLHLERGIRQAAEVHRIKPEVEALLILRDEDDRCPAHSGPEAAGWLRSLALPFPAAVVMLHREYETLFLPCIDLMAGKPLGSGATARPGIVAGARFDGDPQKIRGAKEWLTQRFPPGKAYKPTLDQLLLTRMISFERLRASELPCFGTLERALNFLGERRGVAGAVYPER